MDKLGWFLLGGAVAYGLFGSASARARLSLNFGAGVGGSTDRSTSFKGQQLPAQYDPLGLGTYAGLETQYDGYVGYGAAGVAGGGQSWAQQSSLAGPSMLGVQNLPAENASDSASCGGNCAAGSYS